jgi:N-methylhydantoinase A
VAFGGGGPLHAAGLAEELGIGRMVVPPSPGVFSAFGLLFADLEHHFVQTHFRPFAELDFDEVNGILERLRGEGRDLLRAEGFEDGRQQVITQVDMKYVGQTSELTVAMPQPSFSPEALEELGSAYGVEHERTYGYRADDPLQLVSVRVVARGLSEESRVPEQMRMVGMPERRAAADRDVYFMQRGEWIKTPVIGRDDLGSGSRGPLVVEEYDSTAVVPPGWSASLDFMNNIVLERAD